MDNVQNCDSYINDEETSPTQMLSDSFQKSYLRFILHNTVVCDEERPALCQSGFDNACIDRG
jgi:hypothetical protein